MLRALLAEDGRTVIGVDPAEASLEVAKAKDRAGSITWIHGDATTASARCRLAFMTGNVAQVFLTDDDWTQTLQGIHAALRSHGYFVFETRRPERRGWEEWVTDTAPVTLDVPGIWLVERWPLEITEVSLPFVSFRYTYRFASDGVVITSDSTLRFRDRDEVESSLLAGGYRVLDVRDAPDRPGREFVFIAERTT